MKRLSDLQLEVVFHVHLERQLSRKFFLWLYSLQSLILQSRFAPQWMYLEKPLTTFMCRKMMTLLSLFMQITPSSPYTNNKAGIFYLLVFILISTGSPASFSRSLAFVHTQ